MLWSCRSPKDSALEVREGFVEEGAIHGAHMRSAKGNSTAGRRTAQMQAGARPCEVGLGLSSSVLERHYPPGVAGRCDRKVEQHERALSPKPRRGAGLQVRHGV